MDELRRMMVPALTCAPRLLPAMLAMIALPCGAAGADAQAATAPELPFKVGEALRYQVRVTRVGDVGTGRMWIEGPVVEQGTALWVLRFEMEAGKGPIRATDRTASWFDPARFATVRYTKQERHLLSRSDTDVRIDLAAGRWRDNADAARGRDASSGGPLGAMDPLDELSFLYFLRTIPLERDTVIRVDRHFDPRRNPTIVRVVGRDTLETPAGIFRTRVVEMEVRDPARYRGTGLIRLHLLDGDCHIPIRIESRMPILGETVLTLTGWASAPRYPDALPCG